MKSICNFKVFCKNLITVFILLLCLSIKYTSQQTKVKWCWTKTYANEPSFKLDPRNGGMNWAYCAQENIANPIKYSALVDTSTIIHSETNSEISIQLFGDKGEGEVSLLNADGFDKGKSKSLEFQSKDVGDLQQIKLILKGQQNYRCTNITIIKAVKRYNFHCLRMMGPCTPTEPKKCELIIPVDGFQGYDVTIDTGDDKLDATKSPIFITLLGDKAEGQKKLIAQHGFKAGSSNKVTIFTTPIGKVVGFRAELENKGLWQPTKIVIKDLVTKEEVEFTLDSVKISNPGSSPLTYNPGNKAVEAAAATAAAAVAVPKKKEEFNVHDPNGGLMTLDDKKSIIDLKCEQVLKNPDDQTNLFGPDYPTSDVNYTSIIVRCPSNCHKLKNISVLGLGKHPAESPICFSAIVDNAMSLYGGIFSISLFPGAEKYELPESTPKIIKGINIKESGPSKKSYVLAKIDNVNIVEKDIRILNARGELSADGRLEMRYEGEWGTVCSMGNSRESAKLICRQIGYKDGEWKNPIGNEGKNYCKSYNEEDHCGAKASGSLFSDIQCQANNNTINQCKKNISDPNICTHEFDSIISCYDENFSTPKIIPDKTIKLEVSNKDLNTTIGRLELYFNGKWLPVCKVGFTDHSAKIACKQMGFIGGTIVTDAGKAKPFQYDLKDTKVGFNANLLVCKGEEANVAECKMTIHDITCKHDSDVVIICEGTNGDVTGLSQYSKKGPVPVPKLSKLGVTRRVIDCNQKGYEKVFRGDPGSIYMISCPPGCGDQSGAIWGTGVFTSDSYICKAALHAGVTGPNGGDLLFIKTYGQKNYMGSVQNGGNLSASLDKEWPSSFSLSQLNSAWRNMEPLTIKKASFMELNESSKLIKKTNSFLKESSFLEVAATVTSIEETKKELPHPIFSWVPPSFTHVFEQTTNIVINDPKLALKDYTIVFQFTLKDFKAENAYIFSYGGCGGFNIAVSASATIKVGDLCDESHFWNPGFNVPINDKILVYLRYVNSNVEIEVKSSKIKDSFKAKALKNLEINSSALATMGRLSNKNLNHFLGKIDFFFVFKGELKRELMHELMDEIKIVNHNAVTDFGKTADNRQCVSRCSNNPVPPNPGCGDPPREADINQNETSSGIKTPVAIIDPTKDNTEIKEDGKTTKAKDDDDDDDEKDSKADKGGADDDEDAEDAAPKASEADKPAPNSKSSSSSQPNETGKQDNKAQDDTNPSKGPSSKPVIRIPDLTTQVTSKKVDPNNIETFKLTCESNLLEKKFSGSVGQIFRCHCPNCATEAKAMVFGTEIYHPKSSICKAAQHSGALEKGKFGEVLITLVGPKPIFNGSEGIDKTMSATFAGADKSFTLKSAKPITKISCKTQANEHKFANAPTNTQFVIQCPKHCSKKKGLQLFGTKFYTDNSSICLAAIHRGIINDRGGEIKIVIAVGKDMYKASNGFGIASKVFGPHIRSFEFLGLKSAIHFQFKEDFTGKLQRRWKVEKHLNPVDGNSNSWDFFSDPNNTNKNGLIEKIVGIRHTGSISATNAYNFGSWIVLKNSEWANGTVRFNILLKDLHPIAFFFRYMDMNNYYGIEFDPTKQIQNIKLFSKIEGTDKELGLVTKHIRLDMWYRIKVDYNFEKIVVYIQSDNIREHKVLFEQDLTGLSRGTIAFATKGNNNFILSGIRVSRTDAGTKLVDEANKFSWKSVLLKNTHPARLLYCKDLFGDDNAQLARCERPHIFCRFQCDALISKVEKILNYACYQDCVKGSKVNKIVELPKEVPKVNYLEWDPVLSAKCDYRPSGEKAFVPCTVKKLQKIGTLNFASLEYQTTAGGVREVNIQYPSKDLLECGKGLKIRTDCLKK